MVDILPGKEHSNYKLAAVIVTELETVSNAFGEAAEAGADTLADRLEGFFPTSRPRVSGTASTRRS